MIWYEIGAIEDITRRGTRCVVAPQGKIGLFRTVDDRITIEIRDPAVDPEEEPEEPVEDKKAPERDIVRFFSDGTADSREFVLTDSTGSELVLRINPVTGRVRVIEEGAIP